MPQTTNLSEIEDLALDPLTGDLVIDDLGRFVGLNGADRIAQKVKLRVGIQLGEWWLDTAVGVDWLGRILVKDPDLRVVRAQFIQTIASVPEVIQILDLTVDTDNATRGLTVGFTVQTTDGPVTDEVTV